MRVIKLVAYLLIAISAVILIGMLLLTYDQFIQLFAQAFAHNNKEHIRQLISLIQFRILQFVPLAGVIAGILILVFKLLVKTISTEARYLSKTILLSFREYMPSISNQEIVTLLALLFINFTLKFYLALSFPITYDEAWTFSNFTEKGLLSSISYYPAPNNHILYSILTNFLYLFPLKSLFIVRLPAIVGNVVFLALFYFSSRKLFNYKVTLTLTALCSFLQPLILYGITGRGYIFVLVFFIVDYYAVVRLIKNQYTDKTPYYLFAVFCSSVLGFYTMPSFLYPYATLHIFLWGWCIANKKTVVIRQSIYWAMGTVAAVLILYMPVFIVSGVKAVTSNGYVRPKPRAEIMSHILPHFISTFRFLFSIPFALPVCIGIVLLALLHKSRIKTGILNCFIIGFAFLIPVLHSVIPFPRTWVYLIVPVLFSFGVLLNYAGFNKVNIRLLAPILVIFCILEFTVNYRIILSEQKETMEADSMCQFLISNNVGSLYSDYPYTDAYARFAYHSRHKEIICYLNKQDLDNKNLKIDVRIYKASDSILHPNRLPVYRNNYVVIYKN